MFGFALQGCPRSETALGIFGCLAPRHHATAVCVADGEQPREGMRKNRSWRKRAGALLVLIGVAALYAHSAQAGGGPSNNPVPYVSIISPLTVLPGAAGFNLTVTGANFVNASVVYWGARRWSPRMSVGQR